MLGTFADLLPEVRQSPNISTNKKSQIALIFQADSGFSSSSMFLGLLFSEALVYRTVTLQTEPRGPFVRQKEMRGPFYKV